MAALLLVMLAGQVAAAGKSHTPVCGDLLVDTVWTADNLYEVSDCNVRVPAGITLTIQAGTVVKFAGTSPSYGSGLGSTALIVDGTLNANGSAGAPVVFTSLADDSRGGDSNENGASSGAPGDWRGLVLRAGSQTSLQHFQLAYAGAPVFNGVLGDYGKAQIEAVEIAGLSLRNGVVTDGASKGLYLRGSGITPLVADVAFNNNVNATTSAGNRGDGIYQYSINMQPAYSGLSFSGNDRNGVVIDQWGGSLAQDVSLAAAPYFTACGYTLCILYIPDGRTLTVLPGAEFDFNPVDGITVQAGGSLLAEGTVAQPVVFASSAVVEGSNFSRWNGIQAQANSRLRLDHCEISDSRSGNYGDGGLEINTSDAQVRNCHIHHNLDSGLVIYAPDSNPMRGLVLDNLTLSDNGEDGLLVGTQYRGGVVEFTLENSTFERNGRDGLYFTHGGEGPQIRPTLRNLNIRNNGRDGVHFNIYDTYPLLDSLTISNNVGNAVYWACDGSITARGLVATGNGYNGMYLPGCDVYGGHEWNFAAAGVPVDVAGNVFVQRGAFLTLAPGTDLGFASGRRLVVSYGTLFALGTADAPITLHSTSATLGGWGGIEAFGDITGLYLRDCEIRDATRGLLIGYAMDSAIVQNCDIHDNTLGMEVQFATTAIRNNSIRDNVEFGVISGYGALVDARGNYWGDATGPLHASNPAGLGNAVGNNVLFDPWLGEPPPPGTAVGGVVVATGSPDRISPGQTAEYAVQYLNLQPTALTDALVVLQVPRAAEYVSSTGGGVYWPERDQVIWKLGDIASGGTGNVAAQLTFAWGLPRDYRDGSTTLFSAANYGSEISAADRAEYLAWVDDPVQGRSLIAGSGATFRNANPLLQPAFDAALGEGYVYQAAADVQRGSGTARVAVLLHPVNRAVRLLSLAGGRVFVFDIDGQRFAMTTSDGGMSMNLLTGEESFSGIWADTAAGKATCSEGRCLRNCYSRLVGLTYLGKKAGKILAWTAFSFLGGSGIPGVVWEVGSFGNDALQCYVDCGGDPQSHCCSAGQVKWTNGAVSQLFTMCMKQECTATGNWAPLGTGKTCVTGTRCVASIDGIGCLPCDERLVKAETSAAELQRELALTPIGEICKATKAGKPRCKDLELFRAKDPNDIRGEDGDVYPGQILNYTVRFENEGAGRAYGVYILNDLPAELDESTLDLDNGTADDSSDDGQYLPGTRQIAWVVGELGAAGEPDSQGARSYSVQVRAGLASGTAIANQAVVYFPSVPEETPTNTWVNIVAPLAAIPQTLSTGYETALPLLLNGREVSNLPLSYTVSEQPSRGSLSGSPPNLTYTPAGGAVGPDSFRFTVSNGSSTSRPATVMIDVLPTGDSDPPEVVAVSPLDGAARVAFSATAVATPAGDVYSPSIQLAVSEPLDPASVSGERLLLSSSAGAVPALVSFDPVLNQLSLAPRAPLQRGTRYTVTLLAGITDLAGNALAAGSWSFTTDSDTVFHDGFEAPPPVGAK